MSQPLSRPVVRGTLGAALLVAVTAAVVLVFTPTSALPNAVITRTSGFLKEQGAPHWLVRPGLWEFSYNVLLFIPPALACVLLWPRVPVWIWVALGLLASTGIEGVQALFLAGREAQARDVVSNTLGAGVGAALGLPLAHRRSR